MEESDGGSILHQSPLINVSNNTNITPQPPLKKRKLNDNESISTSTANSTSLTDSTDTDSNDIESTSKKRKTMDVDDATNNNKKTKKKKKKKDIFSVYSIKKMLKSDETLNDSHVSSEAAVLIGKATHFFLNELLKESITNGKNNQLEYDDIATYIDSKDNLSFLSDIVPKRVLYREILNNIKTDNDSNTNNKMEVDKDNE